MGKYVSSEAILTLLQGVEAKHREPFCNEILSFENTEKNKSIVKKYLVEWSFFREEKMFEQEKALNILFSNYPHNSNLQNVLLKVTCLNNFYSTAIRNTFRIAKVICNMNIDERLSNGDISLVDDISEETKRHGNNRREFSFVTKYCSFHNQNVFPIYDSRNEAMLKFYKIVDKKSNFIDKKYTDYIDSLKKYKELFGLEDFSYKQIDRFNWTFCNMVIDKYSKTLSGNTPLI